jgi:anti-sigma regulatory factor (Ser/Thr protein kinase)
VDHQAASWQLPIATRQAIVSSTSELVTNAVAISGATDLLKIRLERTQREVVLSVWDASSIEPKPVRHGLTLEDIDAASDSDPAELPEFGGWGLPLVESLASETGADWVRPAPQSGKWIWARFNL